MQHDSQNHAHDDGRLDDADQLMTSVQARLKRITTMAAWAARSHAQTTSVQRELAEALAELALAREELAYLRTDAARKAGLDPEMLPPRHYVDALRTPQTEPYRAVAVHIDDEEWVIGLKRDRPTDVDPLREMRDWQQLLRAVRGIGEKLGEQS